VVPLGHHTEVAVGVAGCMALDMMMAPCSAWCRVYHQTTSSWAEAELTDRDRRRRGREPAPPLALEFALALLLAAAAAEGVQERQPAVEAVGSIRHRKLHLAAVDPAVVAAVAVAVERPCSWDTTWADRELQDHRLRILHCTGRRAAFCCSALFV